LCVDSLWLWGELRVDNLIVTWRILAKLGPINDDLINDVNYWVKEKRPGVEQLLSRSLKTKEMDIEYEKSEEAKKNNSWVLAKEIVTPLVEKGHAKSQGRLGGIYFYGLGEVPKDLKKALQWIKLGADQGDGRSQYFLGNMYFNGLEVPKDLKQSIKFWELAGDKYPKGFIEAQTELGDLYDSDTQKTIK
jgi:TPR repeat protein